MTDIKELKPRLLKTVDYLKDQLKKIRTGRANTALVENIEVEVYGSKMPINQLATVSVPEARSILIAPWDKNNIEVISKAIQAAEIGINPSVAEESIRINLPPMTEEKRKDLVKVVKDNMEKARVSVRNIRKEYVQYVDEGLRESLISEDAAERKRKEIDDVVKEINEKIEKMGEDKEKEIMTV